MKLSRRHLIGSGLSLAAPAILRSTAVRYFTKYGALAFIEVASGVWAPKNAFANFTPPPNDTNYSSQWALTTINAPGAWNISQGDPATVIAILDTGFTLGSEAPANISSAAYNEIYALGLDTTCNTVSTSSVVDCYSGAYGHGSVTASIAMGNTNNSYGCAGIAPNCTFLPIVVVLSSGSALLAPVVGGINYAVANSAHILSMSFNGIIDSGSTLQTAINNAWAAGCCLVSGMGDGVGHVGYYDTTSQPASMTHVIGVGGTNISDVLSDFSNYGCAKLVAPAGQYSGGTTANTMWGTGKNGFSGGGFIGCSFATPQVSAVLGLMRKGANPRYDWLRNDELYSLLFQNCDIVGGIAGYPTLDTSYGYGRLNAYKAVNAAKNYVRPFPVGGG